MRCIMFHYTAVCMHIACVGSLEEELQAHKVFHKEDESKRRIAKPSTSSMPKCFACDSKEMEDVDGEVVCMDCGEVQPEGEAAAQGGTASTSGFKVSMLQHIALSKFFALYKCDWRACVDARPLHMSHAMAPACTLRATAPAGRRICTNEGCKL